jgi:anaphase-promoting complex subunit 1
MRFLIISFFSLIGLCQTDAAYGLQMAAHMAMGLVFLGGGSFSLKTSPKAVAAMVVSLFPKFPAFSNDNR